MRIMRKIKCHFHIPMRALSKRSKGIKNYQNKIKQLLIENQIDKPFSEKIQIVIDIFAQDSKKVGDVDNLAKPLLDSFKGLLYLDDGQVDDLKITKHDLSSIVHIYNQPTCIVNPLINGIKEYIYVRIY